MFHALVVIRAHAGQQVAAPSPRRISRPPRRRPLVVAGTTALTALRDSAGLASGEQVLVRGAAGGVGTAAVQLARAMGGRVTALARDQYAHALAGLGADRVIDYRDAVRDLLTDPGA